MHMGEGGYVHATREIVATARFIAEEYDMVEGARPACVCMCVYVCVCSDECCVVVALCRVAKVEGIQVCGEPLVSVVALRSPLFDIYRLAGALSGRLSALCTPVPVQLLF